MVYNLYTVILALGVLVSCSKGQSTTTTSTTTEDPNAVSCLLDAILGIRDFPFDGVENLIFTAASVNTTPSVIPTELNSNERDDENKKKPVSTVISRLSNTVDNSENTFITPTSVLKAEIRYLLFTNKSKNQFQVMPEDGGVEGMNWDAQGKTKVLIHGLTAAIWESAIESIWNQHIFEVKDAYLSRAMEEQEYNIIVVDWTSLSSVTLTHYPEAAKRTKVAGEDVAEFLSRLKKSGNIRKWDDVHIVGHSLGAHVAGVAGYKVQERAGGLVGRITGLDPAGPCFDTRSGKLPIDTTPVLDKTDAGFVDIIHTNMGNVVKTVAGRYGSVMEAGHVDIYPNGGEIQPGCTSLDNRAGFCSHQKSVVYYTLSVTQKFTACPCNDWYEYRSAACSCNETNKNSTYLGEFCDKSARGKYYLAI